MSLELALKAGYVSAARGAGRLGRGIGLLDRLERRAATSRTAHWLRSLPEIHNLDGMIRLDVPWWTYDAIERVDAFLVERPGARVFEYGSGASTVWLARRAAHVTSVEHHTGWHEKMTRVLAARRDLCPVDLHLVEADAHRAEDPLYASEKPGTAGVTFQAYATRIEAEAAAPFDLIVIDGRARGACLHHAVSRLAPGGIIVFDNSARARYRRAIGASGLAAQVLHGLTPSLPYPDETTLLTEPAP